MRCVDPRKADDFGADAGLCVNVRKAAIFETFGLLVVLLVCGEVGVYLAASVVVLYRLVEGRRRLEVSKDARVGHATAPQ